MAELTESKMNFAALKRVDPYAKSLLETAAHVALYTFVDNEWEKTDIEGALFVYSRTGEPFHNILIMNRLNMKNLVEPVTQGLDLQLQDPFLLYRNPQGLIYGIWFYDKEECIKIANTLTKIIKDAYVNKSDKKGRHVMEAVGSNVDIFSMLTKAQEEYNSKSPRKAQPEGLGIPLDMNFNVKESDPTPKSVMDFFAKASNGSKFIKDPIQQSTGMFENSSRSHPVQEGIFEKKHPVRREAVFETTVRREGVFETKHPIQSHPVQEGVFEKKHTVQQPVGVFEKYPVQQSVGVFVNSRSGPPPGLSRMPSVPITIPPPQNDVKPLLQRLMSNPVHSVEHIEKQQRAITPQNDFVGIMRNGNNILSSSIGSDSRNNFSFNVKPTVSENNAVSSAVIPQNQIESSFGFLRISDSPPHQTLQTQQFFNSKLAQNHSPLIGETSIESHVNHGENHRPLSAPMETHLKPALMPPVMFTASAKKEDSCDTISTTTPAIVNTASGNNLQQVGLRPEPLNKNQLLQAMNYLLKHDPEFVNKLHEAYLKSFAELVS